MTRYSHGFDVHKAMTSVVTPRQNWIQRWQTAHRCLRNRLRKGTRVTKTRRKSQTNKIRKVRGTKTNNKMAKPHQREKKGREVPQLQDLSEQQVIKTFIVHSRASDS